MGRCGGWARRNWRRPHQLVPESEEAALRPGRPWGKSPFQVRTVGRSTVPRWGWPLARDGRWAVSPGSVLGRARSSVNPSIDDTNDARQQRGGQDRLWKTGAETATNQTSQPWFSARQGDTQLVSSHYRTGLSPAGTDIEIYRPETGVRKAHCGRPIMRKSRPRDSAHSTYLPEYRGFLQPWRSRRRDATGWLGI